MSNNYEMINLGFIIERIYEHLKLYTKFGGEHLKLHTKFGVLSQSAPCPHNSMNN